MSDQPPLVVAGAWPPDLMPFCGICDMPCERVGITPFKEHHQDYMILHAQCCGKNVPWKIPLTAIWAMKARGQKFYAIVKRGQTPGPRMQAKHNYMGHHGPPPRSAA